MSRVVQRALPELDAHKLMLTQVSRERDRAEAEREALRARVEALEGALRKYGRHGTNCASVCHEPGERRVPTGKPCTCGLDAVLERKEKP